MGVAEDLRGSEEAFKQSEYQSIYQGHDYEERCQPIIHANNDIGGSGPFCGDTEYKKVFKRHQIEPMKLAKNPYPARGFGRSHKGANTSNYKDDYKWKTPSLVKSFAPQRQFTAPTTQMGTQSEKQDAYDDFTADERCNARPDLIVPKPNLTLDASNFKVSSHTTSGDTYVKHEPAGRQKPFLPMTNPTPKGKFNATTNYCSDFQGKMAMPPQGQIYFEKTVELPKTTQRSDYVYKYEPIRASFKPEHIPAKRDMPFASSTVQKDEFKKWPLEAVDVAAWAKPKPFQCPKIPFAKTTNYSCDFKSKEPQERRNPIIHQAQGIIVPDKNIITPGSQYSEQFGSAPRLVTLTSFKPIEIFKTPVVPMAKDTSYKKSFTGTFGEKARSCPPIVRNSLAKKPFHKNTIYSLEFGQRRPLDVIRGGQEKTYQAEVPISSTTEKTASIDKNLNSLPVA